MGAADSGCGGYAELVGHNSAGADLKMGALSSSFSQNVLTLAGDMAFSFSAQVTGHLNGPAGPHGTFDLKCINVFGKDLCTNVPGVAISCDSPVGGGLGLSNYGVTGKSDRTSGGPDIPQLRRGELVALQRAGGFPLNCLLQSRLGLGVVTIGLPFTFGLPNLMIASGSAPSLFATHGQLEANSPMKLQRQYDIVITPTSSLLDQDGYHLTAKSDLSWLAANTVSKP